MEQNWIAKLHRLHTAALAIDWQSHLEDLNAQYGLVGAHALSTADDGVPPAWFNGDVEAISGERWILVVSLNPAKPPPGHYRGMLTPETSWDFWRTHNTQWWYTKFFRPLVRLAATALGEEVPDTGQPERIFATKRMVFVELCPYASEEFALDDEILTELGRVDVGFRFAQQVRYILLEEARPSLVLVNGLAAVADFRRMEGDLLRWERRDSSLSPALTRTGKPKLLWHYEGSYQAAYGTIPLAGFKFLRKPGNHNSYAEIAQLGESLQAIVMRSI